MRRLLFLSFPYASAAGGGERYAERLIEGLARDHASVSLVSSSRALLDVFHRRGWKHLPLWAGIEPVSRLSVIAFFLTLPFFLPIVAFVLLMARVGGTRVVVCTSYADKLMATPLARAFGQRVIWMEHLVPGRSLLQNPYRSAYAAFSRLAHVVAVSEAVASALAAAGVPRSRVSIIPPGVRAEDAGAETPSGAPLIGCVSRLHREKNVAMLLEAFVRVRKEVPEVRLEICGEGPERASLEASAERLGLGTSVIFRGYVPDAGSAAGRYRILAVPSDRESFGIAALEAMACGVPVVAARVGGLPEVIEDGATGLLVPPSDSDAFARALLELLRDDAKARAMGEAGRSRAFTRFSEAKMLSAWKTLIDGHV